MWIKQKLTYSGQESLQSCCGHFLARWSLLVDEAKREGHEEVGGVVIQ